MKAADGAGATARPVRVEPVFACMIALDGVGKRYGDLAAVDGVTLQVKRGEVVALVGSSGSGKSTTLKMINRLIEPTTGRIDIEGEDTRRIPGPELRRHIGYVFQGIGLFPHLTVKENIALPLVLTGGAASKVDARVAEVLDLVELDRSVLGRRPSELSGGQQQRVGVARALATTPKLMLLDEPFGALDPLTRDRLQQTFLGVRRALGLTAVFVTHDMSEALLVADRIAVMRGGRIVQVGTPRELVRSAVDEEVHRLLDTPRRQARAYDALRMGPADG